MNFLSKVFLNHNFVEISILESFISIALKWICPKNGKMIEWGEEGREENGNREDKTKDGSRKREMLDIFEWER